MADAPSDAIAARIRRHLAAYDNVGVAMPDPIGLGPRADFWGWSDCPIEAQFLGDPVNPTLVLCAKPASPWAPGLDSLVIDDPLWIYIDGPSPIDAAAVGALVRQMASWPAGATPDFRDLPAGRALLVVGTLSLASWPDLQRIAAALGAGAAPRVSASIDFPSGFPRVDVWSPPASLGGIVTDARIGLSSVLGPSRQRLQLGLSGTISLGQDGTVAVTAVVPLNGGTFIATGALHPADDSRLKQIFPLFKSSSTPLSVELELSAADGSVTVQRMAVEVQASGVDLIPGLITIDAGARIIVYEPFGDRLAISILNGRAIFGSRTSSPVALNCTGSYPAGDFRLWLDPGTPFNLMSLLGLFGVDAAHLPAVDVMSASVIYNASTKYLSANVRATGVWSIGPVSFTSIGFGVRGTKAPYLVSFETTAQLGKIALSIAAEYDPAGWTLAAIATTEASIVEVLQPLGIAFDSVPAFLRTLTLDRLAVTMNETSATFNCALTIDGADLVVDLSVAKAGSGWALAHAGGTLNLGGQAFTVGFERSSTGTMLVAAYKPAKDGDALDLHRIAAALGIHPPEIVDGVLRGVAIKNARLAIDKPLTGDSTFSVAATVAVSEPHVSSVSVALLKVTRPDGSTSKIAAAGLELSLGLAELPVVGGALGAGHDLGIRHLDIIAGGPTKADLQKLALAFGADGVARTYPADDITSPVALSVQLQLGGTPAPPFLLAAPQDEPRVQAAGGPAPAETTADPGGVWLKVQKSIGPINVRRVGLNFVDGDLWLMIEAGFTIGGIDLELEGLALRFTPTLPPHPEPPVLRGIDVSFDGGAVTIGGGLLAVTRGGITEYDGEVLLKGASFQLTALGSYAPGPQGASLFGFAILDEPLGGPPFFYVTAVAAGFGFNRTLTIPTIDKVPQFALVRAVTGDSPFASNSDLGGALRVMQNDVPIRYGQNWLALGVKFTTFKLLESFALVFAKFGADLEIGLVGKSTLTVPAKADHPIGYADLALEATFRPNEGILAIYGQLTPASYVLSPQCHLTGGFAYLAWFKDAGAGESNGPKAGDFVVTLGGYHPAFKKPDWYPDVPRVGANWQVNDNLLIKSTLYFALTPSTVMAGGSLEATWQSGDLKAWFTVAADFLLCWKPLYYEAKVAVTLGASYRVNLWVTSYTVTVQVGVDLRFWGPPFAGVATVDLYVFSFSINFGDSGATHDPIDWTDFKESFLPPEPPLQLRATANEEKEKRRSHPFCVIRVADGMVKDLTADTTQGKGGPDWVINPERFRIVTSSVIPITKATLTIGETTTNLEGAWETAIGVGPVGITEGDLVSTFAITLRRTDGALEAEMHPLAQPAPVLEYAPRATWSKDTALKPSLATANVRPVIKDTLTGFVLTPAHAPSDELPPINLSVLETSPGVPRPCGSVTPDVPADDLNQANAQSTFTRTLISAADRRTAIAKALVKQGLDVDTKLNVSELSKRAADVLLATPRLASLGAEAHRSRR